SSGHRTTTAPRAAIFSHGPSPAPPGPELNKVTPWVDDSRPARADYLRQGAATPVDCQRHAGSDRRCSGESTNRPADPRGDGDVLELTRFVPHVPDERQHVSDRQRLTVQVPFRDEDLTNRCVGPIVCSVAIGTREHP